MVAMHSFEAYARQHGTSVHVFTIYACCCIRYFCYCFGLALTFVNTTPTKNYLAVIKDVHEISLSNVWISRNANEISRNFGNFTKFREFRQISRNFAKFRQISRYFAKFRQTSPKFQTKFRHISPKILPNFAKIR